MKLRNLIGAAIVAACGIARAHASDNGTWVHVDTDIEGVRRYEVKADSLITSRKGALIVTTRVVNQHTHKIDFFLMGLPLQSCASQIGHLSVFDLSGNQLASQDFVLGGGTITSEMAETICDMAVLSRAAHAHAPAADL